jgi:hypothetical protein
MNDKVVSELRRTLFHLQGLDFILRVGLARDARRDESKIDLLVGCDNGEIQAYSSKIRALLKDLWPEVILSVSDDSVRFNVAASSGGIAICDSTKLVHQVKEWANGENLNGQHRSWVIGYWLPEALCGDLATAKSLYDAKSIYAEIRNLIVPYPSSLSQAIVSICADEIRQKLAKFNRLIKEGEPIESALCLSDIGAATVRLAFARSHCYLRGFQSLADQTTSLQPSDLALYELALHLLQEKEMKRTLNEIRRQL